MKKYFKKALLLTQISLLLLAFPQLSNSQNFTAIPSESPTLNRSVRALGMGNAFIAIEGNEYSPFYNPAGLADLEKGRFKFLSPTVEFSYGGIGLIKDAISLKDDLDGASSDAAKIRIYDDFLQQNIGSFQYVRYEMEILSYSRKYFACGILFDERMVFSFRDQSDTYFDAQNIGDATLYVAGAYGFWGKLLQVGVTLKPVVRFAMNDRITYDVIIGSSSASWSNRLKSVYKDYKFSFSGDLGFKSDLLFPFLKDNEKFMSVHKKVKPSIALTWQDIGNPFPDTKRLDSGEVIGFVENDQSVNIGFAINPKIGMFDTTFEVDIRRLNQSSGFGNKFNLGVEFRFPKILSLRTGLGQGYISGGLSADFKYFILDFATYAEESGIFGSKQGDRRLAVTLNFGI